METAVRKVVAAKALERGQICVCGDYAIVHESILPKYVEMVKNYLQENFGRNSKGNEYSGQIINP